MDPQAPHGYQKVFWRDDGKCRCLQNYLYGQKAKKMMQRMQALAIDLSLQSVKSRALYKSSAIA
jgi:hypothetical protein